MSRWRGAAVTSVLGAALAVACTGSTGDALITFPAYAAGASGAASPFSANGYTVQLTYAHMWIGAIYVNEAPAQTGSTFDTPACIATGIYCAQVPNGLEVDLLDTTPQPFPGQGNGSADLGQSWQLYLVQGDVNAPDNTGFGVPNTADLQGTATNPSTGQVVRWAATVTINASNRGKPVQEAGQPGLNPICLERIINFSGINIPFAPGGQLLLTIDPRTWFTLPIDFSSLPAVDSPQCSLDQTSIYGSADVCIPDSSDLGGAMAGSQDGANLFTSLSTSGTAGFNLTYSEKP